jgi:hypothetical protein
LISDQSGYLHTLAAGTPVIIAQQLGGSYTVIGGYGTILRIDAIDADALGFALVSSKAPSEFSEHLVWNQLRTVYS